MANNWQIGVVICLVPCYNYIVSKKQLKKTKKQKIKNNSKKSINCQQLTYNIVSK